MTFPKNIFSLAALLIALIPALADGASAAARTEHYTGLAKDDSGKLVYREEHVAIFDANGRIQTARTTYFDPNGSRIAELESDFRESLLSPRSSFQDFRDGSSHGSESREGNLVLWRKAGADKPLEEEIILKDKLGTEEGVAGCQGLHYSLGQYLPSLREKKELTYKFLIPGKLDFFRFGLRLEKEEGNELHMRLSANSVFIRIFAGAMKLQYDKNMLRLQRYEGVSNLTDAKGNTQDVRIEYLYDQAPPKQEKTSWKQ